MRTINKERCEKARGIFNNLKEKDKNLVLRLFVPEKDIKEIKKTLEKGG